MAIREILRKLAGQNKFDSDEFSVKDGLTPDEVELQHFKRKEYLSNVKKELHRYREKEKQVLWKGNPMGDNHQIIKAKNVFKTSFVPKKRKRR